MQFHEFFLDLFEFASFLPGLFLNFLARCCPSAPNILALEILNLYFFKGRMRFIKTWVKFSPVNVKNLINRRWSHLFYVLSDDATAKVSNRVMRPKKEAKLSNLGRHFHYCDAWWGHCCFHVASLSWPTSWRSSHEYPRGWERTWVGYWHFAAS